MKERCSKKRIHVVDNTKEISTLDDIHINSIKKFEIKNKRIEEITKQIKELNIIAMSDIPWLSNVEIREKIKDYNYKRINHFREWISQIQGKESTDIPNEVFEKILNELKKEKITDTTKLNPKFMRTILKKLRTHKYYEHTAYIINRINGIPPPQFSPELEQNLSNMFMQTQPLFIKYAPANRLNFISYSYILHKFFSILDMPEYLALFPLLKSRQKIAQNEEVFKKICKELKWTWIPSI